MLAHRARWRRAPSFGPSRDSVDGPSGPAGSRSSAGPGSHSSPRAAAGGARPLRSQTLLRAAEKVARTVGTGFLFAIFAVGGLTVAAVLVPVARRLRGSAAPRDLATQRFLHRALALYVRLASWLRLFRVETHGAERLSRPGTLVVANHPTLLDVVLLLAVMPQADCVVKRGAWGNPFLRPIIDGAGYLSNASGPELMTDATERLQSGRSVLLFPEGSRSPTGELGRFQRGAAWIAIRSGAPVLPVAIRCEPPALKKGQRWYALPNQTLEFSLTVGEPLPAEELTGSDSRPALAARRATRALERWFETRLQ